MAAHQLQYLCVANEGAHRRASDFPSYFILMSSRTPPPHAAPAHAEKQRQHTSLCYMSRGGWPPFRPPTHFVQHSSGRGHAAAPSPPTQPGLISGANRSTGLQMPAQRRTSTLAHAPPHPRSPPSSAQSGHAAPRRVPVSSSAFPRQKERSSGSTTRVHIIT